MQEQYATALSRQGEAMARAQQTQPGGLTPIEKPRLSMQLDQLGRVLMACHEIAGHVENSADRIIGPVPEATGKEAGRPGSSTIEQRLSEAIAAAEMLQTRLERVSQRFNSAV